MNRMPYRPVGARSRLAGVALLGMVLVCAPGCADWSYDRIQIGMTQRECEQALAEESVWRTELGFCSLSQRHFGRTDALLVLLTQDRRVAGKLQATCLERDTWLGPQTGFRLRVELDPEAAVLTATGPIDTLRAIADDLATYRGARPALEAHAWIAAGLVRLMERWPHVGPCGALYPELTDVLERVPGGGAAEISVDRRGVYLFEYQQGTVR